MASAELQIPEHIQETQNITREELEDFTYTESTGNGRTTKKSTTDRKSNLWK